jgi:hypothetical protein
MTQKPDCEESDNLAEIWRQTFALEIKPRGVAEKLTRCTYISEERLYASYIRLLPWIIDTVLGKSSKTKIEQLLVFVLLIHYILHMEVIPAIHQHEFLCNSFGDFV